MNGHKCIRCGIFWASWASEEMESSRFCPICIPKVYPTTLADDLRTLAAIEASDRAKCESERRASFERRYEALHSVPDDDTVPWPERYAELRDLGYPDWQIAKRFGVSNLSLLRQLNRYGIEVRPEFASMCSEDRERTRAS